MQASDLNPAAKPFDFLLTPPASPEHTKHDRRAASLVSAGTEAGEGPTQAPSSRRLSKKDAAAAARRRRHSVDALDFTGLKLMDVPTFLRHIRLHKYTDLFNAHGINFAQLLALTDTDLDRVGVHAQGARTRLLKAIGRYNDYLALNWEDRPAADALDAIIPMGGEAKLRGRSRRNSAPSMFSWPMTQLSDDKKKGGQLFAIDEAFAGDVEAEADDGEELSVMVASAAVQLLSILDADESDTNSLSDSSTTKPLGLTLPESSFRRARAVSAPEPPPPTFNFRGFDIWAAQGAGQSWGQAFDAPVRAL